VGDIVYRISADHERISNKVKKKMVAEEEYYRERYKLLPKAVEAASDRSP